MHASFCLLPHEVLRSLPAHSFSAHSFSAHFGLSTSLKSSGSWWLHGRIPCFYQCRARCFLEIDVTRTGRCYLYFSCACHDIATDCVEAARATHLSVKFDSWPRLSRICCDAALLVLLAVLSLFRTVWHGSPARTYVTTSHIHPHYPAS